MRRKHSIVRVAGAALFTFASIASACAQMRKGAPADSPPMMHGMMGQDCPMTGMMAPGREARLDARLAAQKSQNGINTAQDGVWGTYTAAVKQSVADMSSMQQMMPSMQAKTPVERLDSHIAAIESRAGHLKIIKSALAELFDALTPEQKTKATAVLAARGCGM